MSTRRSGALPMTVTLLLVVAPALYGVYGARNETNAVAVYAVLLVAFGRTALQNLPTILNSRAMRMYLLLFVVLGVATLASALGPGGSLSQFLPLVNAFAWTSVFVSLYCAVRTPEQFAAAIRLLGFVGVGVALSVYVSAVGAEWFGLKFGETVKAYGLFRAFGPLGDQVAFGLAMFTVYAAARRKWARASLHSGALVLTATRGAWLAAVIGLVWVCVLLVWSYARDDPRRRRATRRVVLGISLLTVLALASPVASEIGRQLTDPSRGRGAEGRVLSGSLGIRVFADHPVFGVGYLGFRTFGDDYAFAFELAEGVDVDRATYTTQNQLIQTATDAGVVGAAALLALLYAILRTVRRGRQVCAGELREQLMALEGGLVVVTIGAQSAVWLLPNAAAGYFFFVFAALAVRGAKLAHQRVPTAVTGAVEPLVAR